MDDQQVQAEIVAALDAVDATAYLHARDIDRGLEVGIGADTPVALASVFKIAVLVTFLRQWTEGSFELTDRIRVPAVGRASGPTGLSIFLDEVELSLRDLALSMMCVSDNAATDVVMNLVGLDRIETTLKELGLEQTRIPYDCRTLLDGMAVEMGMRRAEDLGVALADPQANREELTAKLKQTGAIAVRDTDQSTPRETTRLLELIWRDEAAAPEACAEARRILGLQVFRDRLASGFGDEIVVSAKTGTLPFIRNEAGVVEYPDGGRYAVAVFLRGERMGYRIPDHDRVIGTVARLAVGHLRQRGAARS